MSRPVSVYNLQSDHWRSSINMIVYGYPGEGKTVFWGSGENVLIMDSDHGIDSARALGSKADAASVTDYRELDELYEWIKNDPSHGYKWIVWDSLTLFQDRTLIDEIMVNAAMENPNQDEDVPAVRHYLKNMNRIGKYVRAFTALPINFGISCHVTTETDQDGNNVLMPLVQGKGMPSKVAGYMNVIGFLGKAQTDDGKAVQRMLTQKVGRFYAKDRFNRLGKHVDKPTLPKIEQMIGDALGQQEESAPAPRSRRRRGTSTQTTKKEG